MAIKVTNVDVWSGEMPDRSGALDRILETLAKAGANLECVIARRANEKSGGGHVYLTPVKGRKAQAAAQAAGLHPAANMATLRVEASNRPGIGHAVMGAIASLGVNVRGVSEAAVGTKSVAYIGFDSEADASKAAAAIKKAGKKR